MQLDSFGPCDSMRVGLQGIGGVQPILQVREDGKSGLTSWNGTWVRRPWKGEVLGVRANLWCAWQPRYACRIWQLFGFGVGIKNILMQLLLTLTVGD